MKRIVDLPEAHIRDWGHDCVIYDQRCGETHLLEGLAAIVFGWLREMPCTAFELTSRLQAEQLLTEDIDPESFVSRILSELKYHQLLEELSADGD